MKWIDGVGTHGMGSKQGFRFTNGRELEFGFAFDLAVEGRVEARFEGRPCAGDEDEVEGFGIGVLGRGEAG